LRAKVSQNGRFDCNNNGLLFGIRWERFFANLAHFTLK
jgi:hypothetical protein